jgi:LmbE family N-acetylglucosaminyl deacetylase
MIRFHPNEPGQPVPSEGTPLTDWSRDLAIPASALAIGAHPDDVEFGCGATLAKWAAAGCVVHILILTDGSKGTWDPDIDPDLLRRTRREEQRDAARRLGATGEVMFLDEIDGELESSLALRREVIRRIRTVRPVVVLGHDPWRRYRIHPDHRHAGWLVCDAIAGSRDPLFDPDPTLAHHRVSTVLLWEADAPNHVENVAGHVETKLSALEAHASQYRSTMRAEGEDEMEAFRHRIRERLIGLGRPHDMGSAEIFVRLDDV